MLELTYTQQIEITAAEEYSKSWLHVSTDRGKMAKRKHVVLSISDKLEILKMLDKSVSYSVICEIYEIGRSTVSDIKKNRDKASSSVWR